jgi:DNA repair protein RecO (recombination protein O)
MRAALVSRRGLRYPFAVEWTDEGLILSRRRLGESNAVVAVFTAAHGRHLGLVRGGAGRRHGGMLQIGNLVSVRWRARLDEHLGSYLCEPLEASAARVLDDAARLDALSSCVELLDTVLPERQPHRDLYAATCALIAGLTDPRYASDVVRWELGLLTAMGYGLDLSSCAATGGTDDLAYVSPRTGRAVSRIGGRAYADRLLPLPLFLQPGTASGAQAERAGEIAAGLALTGHFIERHLLTPGGRAMPAARERFVDRWSRASRLRRP